MTTMTKAAFLTGITIMACAAPEEASAATVSQTLNFSTPPDQTLQFNRFDPALGDLTGVTLAMTSTLVAAPATLGEGLFVSPTTAQGRVIVNESNVSSLTLVNNNPNSEFSSGFDIPATSITSFGSLTTFFSISGGLTTFPVLFDFTGNGRWTGNATVAFTYSPIPIPGALPLFVTGLAAVGVAARRRKKRRTAAA